jgi:hypothetical protein
VYTASCQKCTPVTANDPFQIRIQISQLPKVYMLLTDWLGLYEPTSWQAMATVKEWWMEGVHKRGHSMKAMASLAMLVSCEVWKEINARVFRN